MGTKYKEGKKAEPPAEKPVAKERKFEFPSNVRQIGGVHKGLKIYIEDYAYTYINKLGSKKSEGEAAAFLIGYVTEELGEKIVVISGAINPPDLQPAKDGQVFSKKDWDYANENTKRYFPDLQVVGWARLQPGYGLYLSSADISNHYLGFTDKESVLFLSDPEEKMDCFFTWNEAQDDLEELGGYFIYYDKNYSMTNYMADSKHEALPPSEEDSEIPDVLAAELPDSHSFDEYEDSEDDEERKEALYKSVQNAKRIAEISRQKRIISMMSSVSALLFFACVIMGIGLLQSGERISAIETQMNELKSGYVNLVSKINDSAYPTFAAQNTGDLEDTDITDGINAAMTGESSLNSETASVGEGLDEALGIVPVTGGESQLTEQVSPAAPETQPEPETQPAQSETSAQAPGPEGPVVTTYIVKKGDTLSYISEKFYGSVNHVDQIMDANGITDAATLKIGKELIIP